MVPRSVIPTLSDPPPVTPLPRSDPVSKLLDLLGSVGYALWTNVMRRLKAWVVKNDSKIFNLKYNITHEIQQQYTSVPEGLNPATYLEVLARGLKFTTQQPTWKYLRVASSFMMWAAPDSFIT